MGRIVITGAAGYVGSRLAASLADAGIPVRALVRRPAPWVRGEVRVCDLTDSTQQDALNASLADADVVVHLAGTNEWRMAQRPEAGRSATVSAAERVAAACRDTEVSRLVYLSTWLVYGAHIGPGQVLTEATPAAPQNAYAAARLESEQVVAAIVPPTCDLVILRMTNAVGPPVDSRVDRWSLLTNDLCRQAVLTGEMTLRTSGLQWRDFIPDERVITVLRHACGAAASGSPFLPAGTYNLSTGTARTVRDMAEQVRASYERMADTRIPLRIPSRHDDVATDPTVVSPAALDALIPPRDVSLDDAIRATVHFCLEHREELAS